MRISKVMNLSLLKVIADAGTITIDNLKEAYLPKQQPGVIQGAVVKFEDDLQTLQEESEIIIDGDNITYIGKR